MAIIRFHNPEYLILLLSIPLMIVTHFYFLKYTKRKAIKFANFEALKRVTGKKILTKNTLLIVLRIIIIFFLIIGISGPIFWYTTNTDVNDFVIAIDTSASMTTEDVEPNRLVIAKDISMKFIDSLSSNAQFGIVSFSGASFVDSTLNSNKDLEKRIINEIDITLSGGTDIGGAIITSTNLLLNSKKSKKIILISDGSNTIGTAVDDDVQMGINYAKKNQIKIFTIGIGTKSGKTIYAGENLNIPVGYNTDVLKEISRQTEGKFFEISSNDKIESFIEEIENIRHESEVSIEPGFGFITISLLLLFVEWGLINTRFRAIP